MGLWFRERPGSFPSGMVKGFKHQEKGRRDGNSLTRRGEGGRKQGRKTGQKEKLCVIANSSGSFPRFLNLPGLLHKGRASHVGTPAFHLCNLLSVGVLELTMISFLSLCLPRRLAVGVSKADVSSA